MTEPAILKCPGCGAPASFLAPFCTHCRGPLTWGAVPLLARGPLIVRADCTRGELPKKDLRADANSITQTTNGAIVSVPPKRAFSGQLGPSRRHACIVIEVAGLDAAAGVGLAARAQPASAPGGYSLCAVPYYRSIHLDRYVAGSAQVYTTSLHAFEFQRAMRPTGEINELELRCADSILQAFVNGQHVAACIDATFGFGAFSWRIQSLIESPTRALIRSVSLYEVE